MCEGDKLLEVNGKDVRELGHQEAGQLISECVESVTLLLKPREIPCESVIYSGWLEKKGGSGLTPRNWRRRWFVLRDNCIAYYYSTPEVGSYHGDYSQRECSITGRTPGLWVLLCSGTTLFPRQPMTRRSNLPLN